LELCNSHTVQVDKSLINDRLVFLAATDSTGMELIELNLALENHNGMRLGHFLASKSVPTLRKALRNQNIYI
jgi:hypothetical protein